ncbi:MAG: M28 family peptidase [Pseudomonadota bacterium]
MIDRVLNGLRRVVSKWLGLDRLGSDFSSLDLPGKDGLNVMAGIESSWDRPSDIKQFVLTDMPGRSYRGTIATTEYERGVEKRLRRHVETLANEIGIRNTNRPEGLEKAAEYIEAEFQAMGYETRRLEYRTSDGSPSANIEALRSSEGPTKSLVVGAHYDTVDCPGANDNATGVAALLEIARSIAESEVENRLIIRFVAFTNEEPPYFLTDDMGSMVYAKDLKALGERLEGMICLETIGYYSDAPGSQRLPTVLSPFFTGDVGDFIAFVSHHASKDFLRDLVGAFRGHAEIPSIGLAGPDMIQGIDFSDHRSFRTVGYKAVMVTDTAFMRYPYYHTVEDTPDKLDYTRFTKVTVGLAAAITDMVRQSDHGDT